MAGILIVGGGQAGSTLAQTLRSEGYEGPVTILGAEPVLPYERPPLSKAYLLGEMEKERLYLRPAAIYEEWRIELRLGTPVTAIDTAAQTVSVGEEVLGYDELALCTGSIPNRLPEALGGGLDGVFTVRSLADIDRMKARVTAGARVLVIGGGYIGLEAAAVAAKLGLSVTVIEMAPRILGRVAAPETADVIRAAHEAHGVEIREGCGLVRLAGEGHVTGAELTDGTMLDVDLAIVGTGIRPDTALAEAAGIVCENGVAVDEMGRTSAPHVWAAGDCASFPYKGGRMRLESVQNAIDQAQAVARNMLGANEPYVPYPWFWSDQYDLKLQIAGLGTGYDRIAVRESEGGRSHWYFKGDRLLAVDAVDAARDYMVGKRLLEMGRTVDPEVVADPATNLKALLKG